MEIFFVLVALLLFFMLSFWALLFVGIAYAVWKVIAALLGDGVIANFLGFAAAIAVVVSMFMGGIPRDDSGSPSTPSNLDVSSAEAPRFSLKFVPTYKAAGAIQIKRFIVLVSKVPSGHDPCVKAVVAGGTISELALHYKYDSANTVRFHIIGPGEYYLALDCDSPKRRFLGRVFGPEPIAHAVVPYGYQAVFDTDPTQADGSIAVITYNTKVDGFSEDYCIASDCGSYHQGYVDKSTGDNSAWFYKFSPQSFPGKMTQKVGPSFDLPAGV